MTANGRGNMRPQSRSPPFLVIGLVVALVILAANYWSLSSNNATLTNEVTDMTDQLRMMSAKKVNAETRYDNLMNRLKATEAKLKSDSDRMTMREDEMSKLQKAMTQKNDELQTLGKDKESCQNNLNTCETNTNGIKQELQQVKVDLEGLKSEKAASNPQDCNSVCTEKKRELLGQIKKVAGGISVLQTLHQSGIDILEFKDSLNKVKAPEQKPDEQKKPEEPKKAEEEKKTDEQKKPEETKKTETKDEKTETNANKENAVPPAQGDDKNKANQSPTTTSTKSPDVTVKPGAGMFNFKVPSSGGGGSDFKGISGANVKVSGGDNDLDKPLNNLKDVLRRNSAGLEARYNAINSDGNALPKGEDRSLTLNKLSDIRNKIPSVVDKPSNIKTELPSVLNRPSEIRKQSPSLLDKPVLDKPSDIGREVPDKPSDIKNEIPTVDDKKTAAEASDKETLKADTVALKNDKDDDDYVDDKDDERKKEQEYEYEDDKLRFKEKPEKPEKDLEKEQDGIDSLHRNMQN